MQKPSLLPEQIRRRERIVSLFTTVAAVLGLSLWFGLLTPLYWSVGFLNVAHYKATMAVGLLAFSLSRYWRLRLTLFRWVLLAPSLVVLLMTPFLYVYAEVVLAFAPPNSWDLPEPARVAPSPNGRMVARLYHLGPGFGGGTRVNVKVSRQWLPGVVEDMGILWTHHRGAGAEIGWEGNSAVIIYLPNRADCVPLMFQWCPKPFVKNPFR